MGLHKLTAGDGYTYLTRQVAAADATTRGRSSLGDYYAEKGESPGVWRGAGLAAFTGEHGLAAGDRVTEEQMKALFGEGLHPNADAIMVEQIAAGVSAKDVEKATRIGRRFAKSNGATTFRVAVAQRFDAYNKARGEKWNAPIDPQVRATIRTEVSKALFTKEYGRGPLDDAELSGWTAKQSRQKTKAIAGYDCTFSPVKSVSTLWALAPREVSELVEKAHHAAVADAMAFMEKHAAYSRLGTNGIAQVDAHGLIAATFTHRDTRASDPDLHTHVAISNKVRVTRADGSHTWVALDGGPLHKLAVAASELYNTRLEGHLKALLPVEFANRVGTERGKRPVREIVGVSTELNDTWSRRRAAIEGRIGELSRQFQVDHGREPTPIEALDLAQQANLETREAKHEPRSLGEQRATWWAEAVEVLGDEKAVHAMIADALSASVTPGAEVTDDWFDARAERIIDTVSTKRARWQANHVRAEAERIVRLAGIPIEQMNSTVERLTATALGSAHSIELHAKAERSAALTPEVLRRRDGASVYTTAGAQLYTCEAVVAAEKRLVHAAGRTGAAQVRDADVDMALLESAANGAELNTAQQALVRHVATTDHRVSLALAPAGTGKTRSMTALAQAWNNGAGHRVLGLAPSASAAAVLRADINTSTDNLAKLNQLIFTQARTDPRAIPAALRARAEDHARTEDLKPSTDLPDWFSRIGPGSLVVIDEAGMAGTQELDLAVDYLIHRGAKVSLIGDDRQLASISAGGVLRDIADTHGSLTLSNVVRFRDLAEGPASLGLRVGDESALGYYLDNGRIHVGSTVSVTDAAYDAWRTDMHAGHQALMLAYTQDTVNELNQRARQDRIAAGEVRTEPTRDRFGRNRGPGEVRLADGLHAGIGDVICTRENDRRLAITRNDWVRNGDRWQVDAVNPDGSLRVRHLQLGRTVSLPADYVEEHTTLGYARTIHAAQGMTEDTCHTVLTGSETRELLYVAMTRGRDGNHIYVGTASDGDLHEVMTAKGTLPPTVVDMLGEILHREGAPVSAHGTIRELSDPHTRLGHAARSYQDAIGSGAEHLLGADTMARIDEAAENIVPGLTDEPAWDTLRKHLATIELSGRNSIAVLTRAAGYRELDSAVDKAAVLDWRLDPSGNHDQGTGPLPWLAAVPTAFADHPVWNTYLSARAQEVSAYAEQVRAASAAWTPTTSPVWARPYIGEDNQLLADLAVFRAARTVDTADRRPAGPDEYAIATRRAQDVLRERAAAVAADPAAAAQRWKPLAESIDRHLVSDPFWLELAARFDRLSRAGVDVADEARTAAATAPLPSEMPAAALWWRLSRTVDSGALEATGTTTQLRPEWTADVAAVLGDHRGQRVLDDPAWPALVAAIESAGHTEWTPHQLLDTAHELLHDGQDGVAVPAAELASALSYRVELLVRGHAMTADYVPPEHAPLSAEEEEAQHAHTPDPESVHYPDSASTDSEIENSPPAPDDLVGVIGDEYVPLSEPPALDDELAPPPDDELAPADYEPAVPDPAVPAAFDEPDPTADEIAAAVARVERAEAEYNALEDQIAQLRTDIDAGTSPHVHGADPIIMDLRRRADEQFPYAVDVHDAKSEWIEAEVAAEVAAQRLVELRAEYDAAAHHDPLLAELTAHLEQVTDPSKRAELAAQLDALRSSDAAVGEALDLELATVVAASTRQEADDARTRAEHAQQRLDEIAGPHGTVDDNDVQTARLNAEQLDYYNLDSLLHRRNRAEFELGVAQRAAAYRAVQTLPQTERRPDDVAAAADTVPVDELAGTRAAMRENPIRLRSDGELARAVARIRSRIQQDSLVPVVDPNRVPAAEKLRAEHTRLAEQAAAINAARSAAGDYDAADRALAAQRAELATLRRRLSTAKRRERLALTEQVTTATAGVEQARARVADARNAAGAAAAAVGVPENRWDDISFRAEHGQTPEVIADAEAADRAYDATTADLQARRDKQLANLTLAETEQQRRASLSPGEQRSEERIRTDEGTSAPRPVPTPDTTAATPRPHPHLEPGPERGPDVGL